MADINAKESPFTPGRPVPVEYFVARYEEVQRLKRAIKQTVSGRNENIFITGQRGIGKSSLAGFVRYLAEREYNLIGSHCFLSGVRTLEDMMGVIFQRLLQDCADKSLFEKFKEAFGDYIKGLTLFGLGVEFTKDKDKLQTLVYNFLPVMRRIYEQIKSNGKEGLILILDDMNGITDIPQFSQFLKSFVDELATSGKPLPIFLVLVGLPERRNELIKHQPSVARIFDIVDLPTMNESESEEFFKGMFGKQNIIMTDEALSLMVGLSGGFPMLMHEVGDSVFWQDTDGRVDDTDAVNGIAEAARTVGRKYIDPKISTVLRSKTYTSILRTISEMPSGFGATFERQNVLQAIPQKEQENLDNFLQRTKNLGIIEATGVWGEYRFVNPLYHLYVWYEAKNKKK